MKVGFDGAVWSKGFYDNGVAFFVNDSDKRNETPVKTTGDTSVAIMEVALDFIGKPPTIRSKPTSGTSPNTRAATIPATPQSPNSTAPGSRPA